MKKTWKQNKFLKTNPLHVSICVEHRPGEMHILATLNNVDLELTAEKFHNLARSIVQQYEELGIKARIFHREDTPDYFIVDKALDVELRYDTAEKRMEPKVAYHLAELGVVLTGFIPKELKAAESLARRSAFITWEIDDIYQRAKEDGLEIDQNQADEVLRLIVSEHDACNGCSWDTITSYIERVVDKH